MTKLELIKQRLANDYHHPTIKGDVSWLIEELEHANKERERMAGSLVEKIKRIEKLEEALRYYERLKGSYALFGGLSTQPKELIQNYEWDIGEKAREALDND